MTSKSEICWWITRMIYYIYLVGEDNQYCRNQKNFVPANNYMFKINNRNTRTRCEICSKLTIKTPERRLLTIVNFEHISHLVVFILLALSK